ncbi:MAG: type II secretion system F family protein [Coriobacteriia bacterium]|nr:type II secretion system F family protein [Coriobacteriia bacterium]
MTARGIGLIVAILVAVITWVVLDLVFSEERRVSRRLKTLSDTERRQADELEPLMSPFRQRVLKPAGQSAVGLLHRLMPQTYRQSLERRARMAGNPGGIGGDGMIALKVLSVLLLLVLGVGFGYLTGQKFVFVAAIGVFSAIFGWFLPGVWLGGRIARRQELIRRELPDMLDMLMIAVEAGLGFDAAVAKFIRARSGPLAEEFAVELNEVQAGMSRREALRKLADRCDVFELSTFCMAMVQADVFGVSVGNVLRTQAAEMRLKRRQHAEEVAQKVPAKMVFPLVLCILPATLIVLVTPAIISIVRLFSSLGSGL